MYIITILHSTTACRGSPQTQTQRNNNPDMMCTSCATQSLPSFNDVFRGVGLNGKSLKHTHTPTPTHKHSTTTTLHTVVTYRSRSRGSSLSTGWKQREQNSHSAVICRVTALSWRLLINFQLNSQITARITTSLSLQSQHTMTTQSPMSD